MKHCNPKLNGWLANKYDNRTSKITTLGNNYYPLTIY